MIQYFLSNRLLSSEDRHKRVVYTLLNNYTFYTNFRFQVKDIPENLRSRDHIVQILRLDEEASEAELTIERAADIVLRDLKKLYENSIKPLEGVYKYRDLSNRHFGDPEIFSKPLVLFMGPWSGGKSSILNYLTGLEFTDWSLRTGKDT